MYCSNERSGVEYRMQMVIIDGVNVMLSGISCLDDGRWTMPVETIRWPWTMAEDATGFNVDCNPLHHSVSFIVTPYLYHHPSSL